MCITQDIEHSSRWMTYSSRWGHKANFNKFIKTDDTSIDFSQPQCNKQEINSTKDFMSYTNIKK